MERNQWCKPYQSRCTNPAQVFLFSLSYYRGSALLFTSWRSCLFSHFDVVLSVTASLAIEDPVEALDGQRPVIRPIPHVAILRDEFTQLFNDDYEEEEEVEARGEHTLSEKFGGHFAALVNGTLCLEFFRIHTRAGFICVW